MFKNGLNLIWKWLKGGRKNVMSIMMENVLTLKMGLAMNAVYVNITIGIDFMARREMTKMKISTIIKAYICMNKDRYCYSSEIAKFINENYFTLEKTVVNPKAVTRMIMDRRHYGIFRDVEINEEEHLKKFKLIK